MANTPKKQDSADEMLAAIEDALRLSEPVAPVKPLAANEANLTPKSAPASRK